MGHYKKLNILLLFDSPCSFPSGYAYTDEFKTTDWKAEAHIYHTLTKLGHTVRLHGMFNNVAALLEELHDFSPDLIFNLAEVFNQSSQHEKNVVSLLEMLNIPYTGSSSASLFLCNDKSLTKKVLNYHKIKVPQFKTYYRRKRVVLCTELRLPVIVKPLCDEGSRGISQASVVDSSRAFVERLSYIHKTLDSDAIAEEYIPGREFYVGVIGHKQIEVLPPIEMQFTKVSDDEPRIATYKAKWDLSYRKRWGIKNVFPLNLPLDLDQKIRNECKRAYNALNMKCYARFDVRVTQGGRIFIIEANANPCIAKDEDFASSAKKAGYDYSELIQKIIDLSMKREL
jgi:D-alanine-D-alanine ligase